MGREGFESFFEPVVGGVPHKIMWGGGESWENKFLCILCSYGKRHEAIRLTRGPQDWGPMGQFRGVLHDSDRAGEASEKKERRIEREEL
jgi:hypothetical protein